MSHPAVFVIDMLNDCFSHVELQQVRASLCSSINELTSLARQNGLPVIWVRQEFESDLSDATIDMKRENIQMFVKGTRGALLLDELTRTDFDLEIVKKRYSMFFGTNMDELLERLDVNEVILSGVNSHACVRMSAIDAYQRDLPVTIVRECVASKDVLHHDVTLDYIDGGIATVVTLDALRTQLAPATKATSK
jgi:maleamate amidohydrolase